MIQKIIKVGNSAALTIPQSLMRKIGWNIGDTVDVHGNETMKFLMAKDVTSTYNTTITPEFKEWLDSFTKRNKELLAKLAK